MSKYKMLDVCVGTGSASQPMREDPVWTVTGIDLEDTEHADIVGDVREILWEEVGNNYNLVWASPPCKAFSNQAANAHLDADGSPVSDFGRISLQLVHSLRGLIRAIDPDWYFIENPMGGLRREKGYGEPDAHVWWCQYGSNRAKPTDLWGCIPPSFDARQCRNRKPWEEEVTHCHHEAASRGEPTGTHNPDLSDMERGAIPRGLAEEVKRSVEDPGIKHQRTLQTIA